MVRPLDVLRRDQAEVLEECRRGQRRGESVAVLPRPGGVVSPVVYGRVTAVVTSDPTYGPHLVVVRQRWTGTPPSCSDMAGVTVRCYPSPNRSVSDDAVDDYLRVVAARGAMIAEALP